MYVLLGFITVAVYLWLACARFGRIWLLSPIAVFLVGTIMRWGIGALLVRGLGNIYIPDFDWGQYRVTFEYMTESTRTWSIFTGAIVCTFIIARCIFRDARSDKISMISRIKDGEGKKKINRILCWLGLYTGIATLVPFIIGSSDRGVGYVYWATQLIRPEAVLLILARLRYVFFFLCGVAIGARTVGKARMPILLGSVALLAVIGGWQGSRGDFMYPVLMIVIGWLMADGSIKKLAKSMVLIFLLVAVSVPVIAAFRDTSEFSGSSQLDIFKRIGGLASLQERPDLVKRRFFTLGREVYACSDAYVYKSEKELSERVGFGDLTVGRLIAQLKPAVLGGSKEKFDSAGVVQNLIGIQRIRSWYPCLYMPADLYRRGGVWAVVLGGIAYGLVLSLMSVLWGRALGVELPSYAGLIVWALPISMIQAPPAGTVLEVIWFALWEVPKYVIAAFLIGWIMENFYGARRRC